MSAGVMTVEGHPIILLSASEGVFEYSSPASESAVVVIALQLVSYGKIIKSVNVVICATVEVRSANEIIFVFKFRDKSACLTACTRSVNELEVFKWIVGDKMIIMVLKLGSHKWEDNIGNH